MINNSKNTLARLSRQSRSSIVQVQEIPVPNAAMRMKLGKHPAKSRCKFRAGIVEHSRCWSMSGEISGLARYLRNRFTDVSPWVRGSDKNAEVTASIRVRSRWLGFIMQINKDK